MIYIRGHTNIYLNYDFKNNTRLSDTRTNVYAVAAIKRGPPLHAHQIIGVGKHYIGRRKYGSIGQDIPI